FQVYVDGVVNNQVVAGTTYNLVLRAVDANGNTILNGFPASVNLNWNVSGSSMNGEGRSIEIPLSGTFNFVNGECTDVLQVTAYNSSNNPVITVQHATTFETGNMALSVLPGAFHHFGVS